MKSTDFERQLLSVRDFLLRFSTKLAGRQDAEDLMQQTMMKAWEYRDSFVPGSNFRAWIFTILRNEFYSQMRRKLNPRAKMVSVADFTDIPHGITPPDQIDVIYLKQVQRAISHLSPEQQETLELAIDGHSYQDIAKMSRCSEGTIKSRIARARRDLEDVI